MNTLKQIIFNRHDIYCNQKYGDGLPYSFHLKAVLAQGQKFIHLIPNKILENVNNRYSLPSTLRDAVVVALVAHDIQEDGRMTYNDIKDLVSGVSSTVVGTLVADIVYCVTDEKGKNRAERKRDIYYQELSENNLAVFVKLADIAANTLFSKLTGHSMYDKYKQEFAHFKEMCYKEEFEEFFNYVENI